jgi:hypothetical protein
MRKIYPSTLKERPRPYIHFSLKWRRKPFRLSRKHSLNYWINLPNTKEIRRLKYETSLIIWLEFRNFFRNFE